MKTFLISLCITTGIWMMFVAATGIRTADAGFWPAIVGLFLLSLGTMPLIDRTGRKEKSE